MSALRDIWLIKDDIGHFHPLNNVDREKADKIPVMEPNQFTVKRVRNGKHHRLYFAMLKLVFDNQDKYQDFEQYRKIMEMKAGYYDCVVTHTGKDVYLPKSIAYDSLDEAEFSELHEKVFLVLKDFVNISREDLDAELNKMI